MQVGQTYKIQAETYNPFSEMPILKSYKAKLIQETNYFYVFEYKNEKGYIKKSTITKNDYKCNPKLIQEM